MYIYFKKKQKHLKRKNVFWIKLKTNSVRKIDVGFCLFFFSKHQMMSFRLFFPPVWCTNLCVHVRSSLSH